MPRDSRSTFWNRHPRIVVRISVRAIEDITLPIVGFMMRNHIGLDFAGTNTAREAFDLPPMTAGDIYTVDFHVQLPELYPSAFSFSPAIADGTLHSYRPAIGWTTPSSCRWGRPMARSTDTFICPAGWN